MEAGAVDRLRAVFDVTYDPDLFQDIPALTQAVAQADAWIVRNRTQVRGPVLAAAQKVRILGRLGVGLDNIDMETCRAMGIEVCPATGANDLSVAEYAVTMALVLLRGAYYSNRDVMDGAWPRNRLQGREAAGKNFGFIGFGAISRRAAGMARALGFKVGAFDPFVPADDPAWNGVENLSLADLAGWSDVVSLHVPLTDATRYIVGAEFIAGMKPGAVLINSARGGTLDEAAVIAALKAGKLGGAALDVFETEPLTRDAGDKFRDVPNLILTPHIAGVTQESDLRVSGMIADRVIAAFA
ncbi:hydroxyacid dehydrogenase [Rhodospirillaceae bacterium KN72]|uniref:Hydroxyacid dehydrogenase n=2 Tax=Pacificispira spongiicola TaxID=2729598 RepID=A0A7Y0E190_9PROT|nr:hydroxyacid dehydrogenase [Pacificispira spongiicola]